ncbi:MAG: hypothetical protein KDC24_08245 [Saprospiraceae bacterium]|nr:hypothetical protein [Saprospiraceae bacterium]
MSFAGHVIDMMKRMQANRAMQKGGQYFEKAEGGIKPSEKRYNPEFANKPESLKKATREKINEQLVKERKRDIIWLAILVTLIVCLLILFL